MAILLQYDYPLPPMQMQMKPVLEEDPHYREMQRLRDASDALPEDQIVGRVLAWQRGDGYALYLVVHDGPLILQWIPFQDEWKVGDETIRGLTPSEAEEMVARRMAFVRMVAR